MKLLFSLRSSLLIVSVLSSSLHTNAFTLTSPLHQSTSGLNNQRLIKAVSRKQSTPMNEESVVRQISKNDDEDVNMNTKCDENTLALAGAKLVRNMVLASIVAIGSSFVTDVALVSAVTTDHINGTLLIPFYKIFIMKIVKADIFCSFSRFFWFLVRQNIAMPDQQLLHIQLHH